eukprot:TRINITY_DN20239_c0_g1_i5.p1 TRINITY_DN20239_c0_g1~~TRINITY_DN20239_c0_g1_i5.p1  ORF type:complete len:379 (-),score=107.51 TRINITY_DN20239_c0_g1_i5:253-1389(-)
MQSSNAIQARIQALNASIQATGDGISPTHTVASPSVDQDDGALVDEEEVPEVDLSSIDDDSLRGVAEQLQTEVRGLKFELSKGRSKLENKTRHFESQKAEWELTQTTLEAQRTLLEGELKAVTVAVQQQQADAAKLTSTLKSDLNDQVERYLALRMEVEEARSTPSRDSPSPDKKESKERARLVAVQRKLDSVTADHQWLLTQYVTVNSQNAEIRKKEQLALDHIKSMEQELHRRQSKHEDEAARLMAEGSQAQARELQALGKLQEAKAEIADLLSQNMLSRPSRERANSFGEDTRPKALEESAAAFRQHIAGALSNATVVSNAASPGGNFAPAPIRGGGGIGGITNLTDRSPKPSTAGAAAEVSPSKKPNFFKRLFS